MNSVVKVSEIVSETFDEYIACYQCQKIVKSTEEDLLSHNEICSRMKSEELSSMFEAFENVFDFDVVNDKSDLDMIFQECLENDIDKIESENSQQNFETIETEVLNKNTGFDMVFQESIHDDHKGYFYDEKQKYEVYSPKSVRKEKIPKSQKRIDYSQETGLKFHPIMTVVCRSSEALMYKDKFESGGKGKCIFFEQEWWTPNQFELKAGSKSKKYLASLKCLGA